MDTVGPTTPPGSVPVALPCIAQRINLNRRVWEQGYYFGDVRYANRMFGGLPDYGFQSFNCM